MTRHDHAYPAMPDANGIPVSIRDIGESVSGWPYRKPPDFAAIVQDRASEMITHCDNAERVAAIGEELYALATNALKDANDR